MSSFFDVSYAGARGLKVRFVELYADLATRLDRNDGADRLAATPSKRDLERSATHLMEREEAFTMNTSSEVVLPGQRVLDDFAHLRLSTTEVGPGEAAARILAW